jgi:hypothetical protein
MGRAMSIPKITLQQSKEECHMMIVLLMAHLDGWMNALE